MNTILIAEDEKLTRAGLKTMISRSGVPIGLILEARDGKEALEILHHEPVDLLITDIRMPGMDGIELVSHLKELEHVPALLVVSGYESFSYAVAMFREGAQNYLLKPVDREEFYAALWRAEEQCQSRKAESENRRQEYLDFMRQLMLGPDDGGDEWREKLSRYGEDFFTGDYVGYCSVRTDLPLQENVLKLRAVGKVMFYAASLDECAALEKELPLPVGKSGTHQGLEMLRLCYQEAYRAWQTSFFTGKACEAEEKEYSQPKTAVMQLTALVGLSKWQEAVGLLRAEAGRTAAGEMDPEAFAELCGKFVGELGKKYSELADDEDIGLGRYRNLWDFENADAYLEALERQLEKFCDRVSAVYADYANKQKIQQAVQYVKEHFRESLNMTEVSNKVSMNYTMFSTLFKQYTGVNFVSFLQNLRIEESRRLLETTEWRIYEIGHRAGFSDEKHFLKTFKAITGLSPTEYRKASTIEHT